jgi:hypothetical protein
MSSQEPTPRQTDATRGPDGKYIRSPETAERDAYAASLRAKGYSYRAIGAEMGVEATTAHEAVQRALRDIVQEPAEDAKRLELERLDEQLLRYDGMRAMVMRTLENRHYTVSSGKLICLDDEPLEDDGFVLQAADRLRQIEESKQKAAERRARLLGLDAPQRVSVEAENIGREIGELLVAMGGAE